jgi:hypothetical protein
MVTLEYDDTVAFVETGARVKGVDDADAFMTQMARVVVNFEIVCLPDA